MAADLDFSAVFSAIARHVSFGIAVWQRVGDDAGPSSFVLRFANELAHPRPEGAPAPRLGATLAQSFDETVAAHLAARFTAALGGGVSADTANGTGNSVEGAPRAEPAPLVVAVDARSVALLWEGGKELRRAAEELRATNRFLDSIVENLPAMIFIKDAEHLRFERFNRAGEELIGLQRADLLGKSDYDFFPPEQAKFFQEKDRETLRSGAVLDIPEEPLQTKHGLRWLHTKKIPILDEKGEPAHLLGIAMDITARKAAADVLRKSSEDLEQRVAERTLALSEKNAELQQEIERRRETERALQESQEHLRLTLSAIPQIVWTAHPSGKVEYLNQRWLEYTGQSEIPADNGVMVVHEDDRAAMREQWAHCMATGDVYEQELRVQRARDGAWRWHLARALPLRNEAGVVVRWVGTATDIDDQKRAENAQRLLVEQALQESVRAEEANRLKDQFLATVSHELRTPLTAILGWSSILSERPKLDPALLAKGLSVIQRNAQAQAKLVDDILDVSRVMTGKLRIEPKSIDVVTVVKEAMDAVRPSAFAKEIELELREVGVMGQFLADPERLRQIAWNLLSNAVKFTPPQGRVQVELSRGIGQIVLKVRDTGQGIDADFLPYVFERFRQADGSTTRSHGGLGLGLAIVRHLVELHGGHVAVESEGPGRGAEFTVVLPVQRAKRARTAAPPARVPVARGRDLDGRRIIVVDDEPDARELLGAVLEDEGASVKLAGSAREALEPIDAFRPDTVITDIGMPGEDGFDLVCKIKERSAEPAIRTVAVTAYARPEDEQRALAGGFNGYLAKPLEPESLIAVLRGL